MDRSFVSSNLTRRELIGLVATTAVLEACSSEADDPGPDGAAASTGAGGTSTGEGGAGGGGAEGGAGGQGAAGGAARCEAIDPSCKETLENILGPYYRPGAPFTTELNNPSGKGQPLRIEGKVYASDCVTPLAGAIVEVWQADADAVYDNQNGDPGPNVWILRGRIECDECGRYAFESIIPGHYLNGAQYRPAHIHYLVTHPSVPQAFVTQLFFEGDPYNEVDPWFDPAAAVALTDRGGVMHGTFDLALTTS